MTVAADVVIARRTAVVRLDGAPHRVRRERTIAHVGHPIVREYPELWRPLTVDYDLPGSGGSSPAQPDPGGPDRPSSRARRSTWEAYAVALGGDADQVAALDDKSDVIALADELEAGEG